MGINASKPSVLKTTITASLLVLITGGAAMAQSSVTLTAAPSSTMLPDGQVVPMWGYTCGAVSGTGVSCTAMNGSAQTATTWQPPLITVPSGQLTITLINKLSFTGSGTNTVPTSLVIVGQVGGGLGTNRAMMPSPPHAPQGTSWPGTRGSIDPATAAITVSSAGAGYVSPPSVTITGGSGSGATATATIANGMVTGVTVTSLGSGYIGAPTVTIDKPPCTINGTTCIQATATMDVTVLNSSDGSATFVPPAQADRVRSMATEINASDSTNNNLIWSNLTPGTYLIESGTEPSIQGPMGLYGVLVVTDPASTASAPVAYGTAFDKDVALLFSEIDPTQNIEVAQVVQNAGFKDTTVWNGQVGQCGDVKQPATAHTCYPPAVNYSPLYYLVNGVSFDRTNAAASTLTILPSPATATTGKALLRLVNAGLRMHVPSVVGSTITLLAEDGNKLPGNPRVQNEVLLTAGKSADATIQPTQIATQGTYDAATYAVFDRALSLSTSNQRDGGMQAYISVSGGAAAGTAGSADSAAALSANDKSFYCTAGSTLSVTDPTQGVLGGAVGANGAVLSGTPNIPAGDTLSFHSDGTFTYQSSASTCGGTFTYLVNGTAPHTATIVDCSTNATCKGGAPVAGNGAFTSNVATRLVVPPPGVLAFVANNPSGLALNAVPSATASTCSSVTLNSDGSFVAVNAAGNPTTCAFNYNVSTATKTMSAAEGTITVTFPAPSNLVVNVYDAPSLKPGSTPVKITDYRWIIEEDRTLWIDPKCQINTTDVRVDSRGNACPPLPVESLGYNFHTANMPVVAQGCTGPVSCESGQTVQGSPATCDIGDGACRVQQDLSGLGVPVDPAAGQKTAVDPRYVHLDPTKRYFISILPGDGVNPTIGGAGGPDDNGNPFDIATACGPYVLDTSLTGTSPWAPGAPSAVCGHAMGGAQISPVQIASNGAAPINIGLQETPLPTAKISVLVFEDDNPLNGENDAGGGVDVLAPNEPGLAGFNIELFDQAGGLGDATGQITYDMFNQPVSNSLAGKIDPITGLDSCPITARYDGVGGNFVGMIPVCPKYESDGKTLSPLAGQAVIANLYPGLYEITATPGADRIGRGEEWLQTNTLDGGKPHEAFIKPNEPGYFQEFGPGGFHVAIGFANPKIINDRKAGFCATAQGGCNSTLTVNVSNNHMARTPDQRTFSSGNYDHYGFTNCYVSVGPADAEDFAFQKCSPDGKVTFTGMPSGTFKISVFDQWNDIMLDGLVGSVTVNGNTTKDFPVTQWRTNLSTRTFIDANGDGVSQDGEPGLALVSTNIRYRDGSFGFYNNTDLNGFAGFNEVFPFMNWLVVETASTRYKPEGVHTVYDAGGPVDGNGGGSSAIGDHVANTIERVKLPANLRVPGAVYCSDADCSAENLLTNPQGGGAGGSSGAIVPAQPWGITEGWQGLLGQVSFMEFAMKPYAATENGGIAGHVIYASTRPFDDPSLSLQLQWEPGVPHVTVKLYSEGVDEYGNKKLTLVDTTTTTSWDDWAQGFRHDGAGNLIQQADGSYISNMNCPGQDSTSPFFATLKNSKQWLDAADATGNKKALAYNSQFKCYDGWSQLNQIQPAPYDGMYKFPSVTAVDPATGKPTKTNCTGCTQKDADGNPMLPAGKYVVEVLVPTGYELVKEEDKNILLGDVYIAPVTQQFAGFGNIFIMPDQAAVNASYNPNNPGSLNMTGNLGATPRHEGDTGSIEQFWPCVGAERIVPDLNSLYPGAGQAAPFAGAKRALCDRKEVELQNQASVLAKFYIFSSTHIAGHFTGGITDDFASEFDPFSPQFGEKFGPPNLPVALRDFDGDEVARVYADQWGAYNGLYFSTYGVNPPNPTGYVPQMAIACMNDPGPIAKTNSLGQFIKGTTVVASANLADQITDPAYNPAYSNFCYETPFMPGFTAYMDTPVIPTMAFADNYNLPDTEYPDATPAIASVVNSSSGAPQGPWVTTGSGTPASVQFTLSNVTQGDVLNNIAVGTLVLTNAPINCNLAILCLGTNALGQAARDIAMAAAVTASINARTATTGYTATHAPLTATVTITAPTGVPNSTPVTFAQNGITFTPSSLLLSGATGSNPALNVTITALGDKVVQNPNFSGPNSTKKPYNQKTITRHYGFGNTRPSTCPASGACPNVTVGGVALNNVAWSDTTISGDVNPAGVPACSTQQRGQPAAKCGELVITAANGKSSIDAITVTIDGSAPWVVTPSAVISPDASHKPVLDYTANFGRMGFSPIQTAIDSAAPGDLIIVTPGTYRENLIMWKPVRLQGVGAASVTINADAHPAGKMDQWRRQVNCAFGLTLDGTQNPGNINFSGTDPNAKGYSCPVPMHLRVDRIPFEAIVGWDASGNGNLAQVLQEPTLMGAYEGAGITVLGRGVRVPSCNNPTFGANCQDFWGVNATGGAGAFTDGSVYLASGSADCTSNPAATDGTDYGTSNYLCNPSRIDGVSIINSSQGGGGVFIHGWGHNLEVANTRISGNHGTLAGGINLGNGETPDAFLNDGVDCGTGLTGAAAVMPCPPIPAGTALNAAIPFQFNTRVHIHHNMIYNNASIGDALFSGTPAGAGAITISSGSDDYLVDHNWMAGNLSTGDGGGVQHLGLSFRGNIKNNYILFNQSTNPTLPTNGGGLVIEGANLDRMLNGNECGSTNDQDCPPGLGDGTGPGIVVDSNLILGNSAEDGSGGGLRLQQINGSEVIAFPRTATRWYDVTVTNNIIANNVAGWDGGGVSLQDSFAVTFVNNTVASNDTTATAGVLFKTLGAIMAASPPPGCTPTTDPSLPQNPNCTGANAPHGPQPAGLVTMYNTPNMIAELPAGVTCPSGYGYSNAADCRRLSKPKMVNDLFWQNRSFSVSIIGTGTGTQSQQNLVALSPLLNQTSTGSCASGANYWDIGLRTDDVSSGVISTANNKLTLDHSIVTGDPQGTLTQTAPTISSSSPVVAQYCNGARVPPENCAAQSGQISQASCLGYNTPVGASETTSLNQAFAFNGIKPTATVDEGHNWLNLVYGPLTLSKPNATASTNAEMMLASRPYGTTQGAYSISANSAAVNHGTTSGAPGNDFYGNSRSGHNDIGAVQFTTGAVASVAPNALNFGNVRLNLAAGAAPTQVLTLTAPNGGTLTGIGVTGLASGFSRPTGTAGGTCGTTLAAGASCTIVVQFAPTAAGAATASLTIAASSTVNGSPVALSGTGVKVDLGVSPTGLLQLGDAFVGTTSAAQTVTLTNTASPAATVTGITLAFSGPFARSATAPGSCAATLAAGQSCTVGVVFKPTDLNPVSGTLTVTADAGFVVDGSSLQLSGNGLLPAVTPASLDFGTLPTGSSLRQTLTLDNSTNVNSNTQAFPFTITGLPANGFSRPAGAAGGTCGTSLGAGATCTIVVQFAPTTVGSPTGSLTISGNGGLTTLPAVTLSGIAVAPTYTASVSPSSIAFGNETTGTTSAAQNLTVTNTGNSALGGMTVSGVNAPFVRVTNGGFPGNAPNCTATLAVGASCTVKVAFAPTAAGPASATVTIGGTGPTHPVPSVSAALTGTGAAPSVSFASATNPGALAGNTLAFGNQTGSVSSTVTLKVVGSGSVTFGAAAVSGTRFSKGADTCSGNTVAAGATCTITVNFNGAGNVPRTGTLSVINGTGAAIAPALNLTGS